MRRSDIKTGCYYIGGKWARIREVLVAHDWSVSWRDIDPETVEYIPFIGVKDGSCTPKTFAAWGKRKVEIEEVEARLAMPKAERVKIMESIEGYFR
ncbi:hypothetical protein [Bradyrhizobium lablabi]|uniref:hypothetical protein n=1 Tax=Bradyrhizobium lablabi TaxID=722472 RepID=UPI0012E3543B|nr:hypothetical protein [Bradyrhizobium lablabi]